MQSWVSARRRLSCRQKRRGDKENRRQLARPGNHNHHRNREKKRRSVCGKRRIMLNRITTGTRAVGRKFRSQWMACQILPILAVLSAVALLPTISYGQVVSSSLVGTLVDPADAPIPNMEITLANPATGATLKTESNAAGLFRFPNLLPGTITLTVRVTGFKAYTQRDIEIGRASCRERVEISVVAG